MNSPELHSSRQGLIFGLGAYGLWGVIPLYFRLLRDLPPLEVLAHRVVWSFLLLSVLMVAAHRAGDILRTVKSRSIMLKLIASTVLIALNWFTYIYAVGAERVVEASLGYFMTPLVNVLLGMVFLGERLRRLQFVSLILAAAGVLNLAMRGNGIPWIALTLAGSFAFYGLFRKTVAVDAALGLFVETALLLVPAAGILINLETSGNSEAAASGAPTVGLLALGGPITTIPLLLFAGAARRLRMATLGFLQYLAPSIQFGIAVAVFREPFTRTQLASFTFIWIAVAIYSLDSIRVYRQRT